MHEVIIYTDGGCKPNPGPGGWAAILKHGKRERVLTGAARRTTNNKMELTAALEALRYLKVPCKVKLHTDSAYMRNAFTQGWIDGWIRRGWKTAGGSPVKNQPLWLELIEETKRHKVQWIKVKGHSGNPMNERVDQLATKARKELQNS